MYMIYDLCDFCRLVMLARWFTKQYRERPDLVKVGGGVFTHKTHQVDQSPSESVTNTFSHVVENVLHRRRRLRMGLLERHYDGLASRKTLGPLLQRPRSYVQQLHQERSFRTSRCSSQARTKRSTTQQWPKEEKEQKWQAPLQKTLLRLRQQASTHQTTHRPQKTSKKATSATQQKNQQQQPQPQVSTQSHVRQRFVQSWVWQSTARAHASTPRPYPSGTTIGRVRARWTVVQSYGSSTFGHVGGYVVGF